MALTHLFRAVLAAACLAGAAAQESGTLSNVAASSTPSEAPIPPAQATPTGSRYAVTAPGQPTTYAMYDPTASGIPSDGLVELTLATSTVNRTQTQYIGAASTAVEGVNDKHVGAAHDEFQRWNIAFIPMCVILGISVVLVLPFAIRAHVRLNRALRAERAEALGQHVSEAPRRESHSSRASKGSSTTSTARGIAALATFLPGAKAAVTTSTTYRTTQSFTVTVSEIPAFVAASRKVIDGYNHDRFTWQMWTLLACLCPTILVWAYIIWVWMRVNDYKQRTGKKLNAKQSAS